MEIFAGRAGAARQTACMGLISPSLIEYLSRWSCGYPTSGHCRAVGHPSMQGRLVCFIRYDLKAIPSDLGVNRLTLRVKGVSQSFG